MFSSLLCIKEHRPALPVPSIAAAIPYIPYGGANGTKAITRLVISRLCKIEKPAYPTPDDNISSKIRYFRELRKLTQDELALKAGVSRSIIAKYEQDRIKNLNPHILLKIAKSLKIAPKKILPSNNGEIKDFFGYFIRPSDFGSKLKLLRIKGGISQKDFARKLKLSQKTIRRYEAGITKPDRETIEKMAKLLKVSVKSLVNGKGGKRK